MSVSEMLCIVVGSSDTGEVHWFRINPTRRELSEIESRGEVSELRPSPSGKYLAVKESREGIQTIDVVDLPALMRDKKYEAIDTLSSYPFSVDISEWRGDDLVVTADSLLSRPGFGSHRLDLFSSTHERFVWNVARGSVVALSASLQDPARYYCTKLAELYNQPGRSNLFGDRAYIAESLADLGDKSGIPCIERAVTLETDELIRTDIQAALETLTQVVTLQKDCLSGSLDELKAMGFVVEPITTLFIDGRPEAIDNFLCVANLVKDGRARRIWLRLDRAAPDSTAVLEGQDENVEQMRASPDGKYLAVQSRYVDVVDLPRLLTTNRYKSIHRIAGSIKEWNGSNLEVTSDVHLSHAPIQAGDDSDMLPLLSKESFLWNGESGAMTPVWNALENPLRYYCEGLSAQEVDKRRIAARGLRLLKNKDAVSCVRAALASETDESLQKDLGELLTALPPNEQE